MVHVAIMKKSWNLLPLIIAGKKTVESRWYKVKTTPWGKINRGDTLYFKDSGEMVTLKTRVMKVDQFLIENNDHALKIMKQYALADIGSKRLQDHLIKYIFDKKYAIFIQFDEVEKVKPFKIDKRGFGMQSAWISVDAIERVKVYKK